MTTPTLDEQINHMTCLGDLPVTVSTARMNSAMLASLRELAAARARIAELEKDAGRYRWLREGNVDRCVDTLYGEVYDYLEGKELDKVIDAAIDAEREKS